MFKKLKEFFKGIVSQVAETLKYRSLSDKEIEDLASDMFLKLIEADVAYDVAEEITNCIKERLKSFKVPRGADVEKEVFKVFREVLYSLLLHGKSDIDIFEEAKKNRPLKIVFMGVNGVGKTTTIAKIAYIAKSRSLKPLVVASDTFRAAAQEQLKKHCDNIGVAFLGGRYGSDPAAVAYDGIVYAEKHGFDMVLIDTAGRMHVDVDLMNELRKVVRVVKPHLKILILDALTGNDAIEQSRIFDEMVGVDGVILTKVDADAKGGAALSVIASIKKPILYIGVGQKYTDLIPYDPIKILELILR